MTLDTIALIERAHQGDKEARTLLFRENTGLVYSVIRRFAGRGMEMEDLFQTGCIGLLKAVDKFDFSFDVKFSTYAVPMIMGEIKRFLRDDGMLKISRSIKENQYRIYKAKEKLEKREGRNPTIGELSEELGMPPEEITMAMEASVQVESIDRTIYQGDGTELRLLDKLSEKEDRHEALLNRIFLEELLDILNEDERKLISLRYFNSMTQSETARKLGVSQVQVSRMEKRILGRLKKEGQKKQSV